jgi:D-glycero-D-manno-heptose 1,7-bisphosphate phosphatase
VSRRCVFLDRDGVINVKAPPGQYINTWDEFRLIPEIVDWIRLFNALDLLVVVVTNQRGVARGVTSETALEEIHGQMLSELARRGARIDAIFVCPHEADTCDCRKPEPGLVYRAQGRWDIDLPESLLIGDSDTDAQLAARCGLRFIRVAEGRILEVLDPTHHGAKQP